MFLKAFLGGYASMIKTSNDLDRLKYAPQRVEDGVFYNFQNKDMFAGAVPGLESLNIEIIDAARVNDTSRFTGALQRDYFAGFDKMMDQIVKLPGGKYETATEDAAPVDVTLDDKILEVVKSGDKKAFRAMRQEIKDQWFALNDDDVADAIMDLSDAVADKDVDYAKEILDNLPGNEPTETKAAPAKTETKKPELTEEESEIIEDIKSAIDDGDEKDFKELLAELKEVNPDLADEWSTAFSAAAPAEEETKEEEETSVVDEIVEDLEAALEDGDMDEAKECLEELKEEVGEDSDLYKEYAAKIAPKKRERRSRRGK